ncbi:MAG: MBOAT family protein [Syntrophomonadaceae bacterium]|nr:MBOAT family protein [Syntrophomonadaceae bacterium]
MLFNSYEFIFLFLPIMLIIYFLINRQGYHNSAKAWLIIGSLFFYSWWNIKYLPLILTSIIVNYSAGIWLAKTDLSMAGRRRTILAAGIIFNVGLLSYFKYADFFITNINALLPIHLTPLGIILPLSISFFTFQQIAYQVDIYRGNTRGEYSLLNYSLFVVFFPQLIAGPIVHYWEMMGQFKDPERKLPRFDNLSRGLFLFALGLAKKVLIADTFGVWTNFGYGDVASLTLIDAWITSLSYTMQLYFDFSAYTDMALGAAMMFNINLPINFNSPYKSLNIQEFWRRWHITLGRFLRMYIYIPLGGNRGGKGSVYRNLMITFLIGGLWHGAAWTFVFWGFLHGLALVVHRIWHEMGLKMNIILAWFLTFNFVNFAWVFFRAESFGEALTVLRAMAGMNGVVLPQAWAPYLSKLGAGTYLIGEIAMSQYLTQAIPMLLIFLVVVLTMKNSIELALKFKPGLINSIFIAIIMVASILSLTRISEFLYFNF